MAGFFFSLLSFLGDQSAQALPVLGLQLGVGMRVRGKQALGVGMLGIVHDSAHAALLD